MTKFISSEFLCYLIVGGIDTALTLVIYQILLLALPYQVAYTISYLSGIPIAYYLNARFVFHKPMNWKSAFQFPLIYLVQYAAGVVLISLWVEVLHVSDVIAPLLVIVCTIPVMFVLSRFIIRGRSAHPIEHSV